MGNTALTIAAGGNNISAVSILLQELYFDINLGSPCYGAALHRACQSQSTDMHGKTVYYLLPKLLCKKRYSTRPHTDHIFKERQYESPPESEWKSTLQELNSNCEQDHDSDLSSETVDGTTWRTRGRILSRRYVDSVEESSEDSD